VNLQNSEIRRLNGIIEEKIKEIEALKYKLQDT